MTAIAILVMALIAPVLRAFTGMWSRTAVMLMVSVTVVTLLGFGVRVANPVAFEALGIYLPLVAVNAIVVAWIAGDGMVVAPAKSPLATAAFAAVCAFATLAFVGFINGMLTTGQVFGLTMGELAASPIAAFGKPTGSLLVLVLWPCSSSPSSRSAPRAPTPMAMCAEEVSPTAFLNALFTAALDNNLVFAQLIGMVSVVLVAGRPQELVALRRHGRGCYGRRRRPGLAALHPAHAGVGRCLPGSARLCARELDRHRGHLRRRSVPANRSPSVSACCARARSWPAAPPSWPCRSATPPLPIPSRGMPPWAASIGAGLGVLLAVVLFAFVRDRIDERLVPAALRGLPITLVTASLMALAFTGVAGIAGGLFA